MRVRPTLQSGYGAARMRREIGTVINTIFSKEVYSRVGILTAIHTYINFISIRTVNSTIVLVSLNTINKEKTEKSNIL